MHSGLATCSLRCHAILSFQLIHLLIILALGIRRIFQGDADAFHSLNDTSDLDTYENEPEVLTKRKIPKQSAIHYSGMI